MMNIANIIPENEIFHLVYVMYLHWKYGAWVETIQFDQHSLLTIFFFRFRVSFNFFKFLIGG